MEGDLIINLTSTSIYRERKQWRSSVPFEIIPAWQVPLLWPCFRWIAIPLLLSSPCGNFWQVLHVIGLKWENQERQWWTGARKLEAQQYRFDIIENFFWKIAIRYFVFTVDHNETSYYLSMTPSQNLDIWSLDNFCNIEHYQIHNQRFKVVSTNSHNLVLIS